jgi:electron transport complex protein RnfD
MKEEGFIVSVGAHIQSPKTLQKMMCAFILALIPAIIVGLYMFGTSALKILIVAIVSAVVFDAGLEWLIHKKISIKDGNALLIGILFALILPPTVPWWTIVIGVFMGLLIGKHVYGEFGSNPFNPVLVGWAALKLSYPSYLDISESILGYVKLEGIAALVEDYYYFGEAYGIESWQSLGLKLKLFLKVLLSWKVNPATEQLICGIGEVSALALLIGGIFLLWRGYIRWQIPLSFLATIIIFALIFGSKAFLYPLTIIHLLGGGSLLAAFFMSTDPATTPLTGKGMVVFGCLCGLVTMIGRLWGSWIEPIWFAILVGNALTPLIDKMFKPTPFGRVKSA